MECRLCLSAQHEQIARGPRFYYVVIMFQTPLPPINYQGVISSLLISLSLSLSLILSSLCVAIQAYGRSERRQKRQQEKVKGLCHIPYIDVF